DLIPRVEGSEVDAIRRVLPAPDVAALIAIAADAASGDAQGADADAETWNQTVFRAPLLSGSPTWRPVRQDAVLTGVAAAALVAGQVASGGNFDRTPLVQYAQNALRRLGRFADAAAF